jgi:predicted metalloprotease with PDZ domain
MPTTTANRRTTRLPHPSPVHYRVEIADLQARQFGVTLTIGQPARQQQVSLPVWIPGSYLVREFAKNLHGLSARQGTRQVPLTQLDKCTWQIEGDDDQPLSLSYRVHASDPSVRMALLDATRGFFNGTALFLRVHGQEAGTHAMEVVADPAIARWSVATAMTPLKIGKRGFGTYLAANYDELVDHPVELGEFWSGTFDACGVPHRFVVTGATAAFDGTRLLADTQKICETAIRFWHGNPGTATRAAAATPHLNYLFMLNAVDDGYGGLEHRNSTALICTRRDLPRLGQARQGEGYTTLLGLISHEYFHTWNVKRLRPTDFATYDYTQENYTRLLWFFEGFTSYYDDLLLRRAGLLDDAGYLKLLNKTINQVLQTPGRKVQSVAQSSFDAWVKYYRPDESTPNLTVSYYTKGALVALCLDLSLRSQGGTGLDPVMRELWRRCAAGPMSEDDFTQALRAVSGRSWAREIKAWVHGTQELPLKELLQAHGVAVHEDPAQLAQRLGLRVTETQGVQIKTVLHGGAAQAAGMAAGDEWLAVDDWRIGKLDDLSLYAGPRRQVQALVARDKRLLRLPLRMPGALTTWRLVAGDASRLARWLAQ